MATADKPVEPALVSCATCSKEVSRTVATTPEATDYLVHFCGLQCYDKWKTQGEKPKAQVAKPE